MTDRNLTSARSRLARLAGALAIGTALIGVPAAFAAGAGAPAATPAPAAAPAAAPAPKPTDVIAKVGDETVTLGDLNLAAEDLQQQLQNVPPQDQKAFLTGVMIDMELMAQAARSANLDQTPDYKAELRYLEDRALRQAFFENEIAKKITPDSIKAAYNDYVKTFQPQDEVHAEHILVKTQAEAQDLEKQIAGGAKFEDLAKSKSIDTGSAAQGGDLGFFAKGQMVKPFEDAAFALNVGQVSQPVQSQYGWHIIKVVEKRKTQPQTLDQMGPKLQQEAIFKSFDAAIQQLKAKTTIEIPDASLAAQVKAENAANQSQGQSNASDSSGQ